MTSCLEADPRGICSWNFRIAGSSLQARGELGLFREDGSITVAATTYRVRKHGLTSGHWTLSDRDEPLLDARKLGLLTRSIAFTGIASADLRAASMLGRTMLLTSPGHDAVIAPRHPFTRRSTITGTWADDRLVVFAFWLTMLLWRRRMRESS